jgi:hypothetical protein
LNKNLTAAIFWQASGANPVGTAWLCSDRHLLTASHCVLDPQTQKSQGPFRLKFPWGEVPCDKIAWWDIGLDVALLAIDPASTSHLGDEIKQLRINQAPASDVEDRTWSSYGFPIANPTGMVIDGRITDFFGEIAERFPAIQLNCNQGGALARYDSEGNLAEFDADSEILALTGASGAAVVHRGEVIALIRSAPPKLGQKVVFATPLWAVAVTSTLLGQVFEQTRQNHIELIRSRWLAWEADAAGQIINGSLEGRPNDRHIDSEIYQLWTEFINETGWHENIATYLKVIREYASKVSELGWLVEKIDQIHVQDSYPRIVNGYNEHLKNANNRISQLIRKLENAKRRSAKRRDPPEVLNAYENMLINAREAKKELYTLSCEFEPPLFSRCFLIIGSAGAGKTHFISQLLAGASRKSFNSDCLVLPLMSSRKDGTIEELLLNTIREASGERDWTSIDEFCAFIAQRLTADAPGSNQQPLKLNVAIDDLDKWIFHRGKEFMMELAAFVEAKTTLRNLYWVFTYHDANYDHVAGDSFFTEYAAIRAVPRTGSRDTEYRRQNFGGWYSLDEFNEGRRVGLEIIRAAYRDQDDTGIFVYEDDDGEMEVSEWDAFEGRVWRLQLSEYMGSTERNLCNPFIAWIVVDLINKNGIDWNTLDLSFVEFVNSFWEKRKQTLASALANPKINKADLAPNELEGFVRIMAQALSQFRDLYPGRSALITKAVQLAQRYSLEHQDQQSIESILAILNQGNLLGTTMQAATSAFGMPSEQQIEILMESFWEYYIAAGLIDPNSVDEDQAKPLWQRLNTIATRREIREGITIFLFLLLTKESDKPAFAELLDKLLELAVDLDEVLSPAIWFAGQRGTREFQKRLTQLAGQKQLQFLESHDLYAFMAFVGDCSPTVLHTIARLNLLKPNYQLIQSLDLSHFYYFVAERAARELHTQNEAADWMEVMTGCEEMDCAPQLAKLTVRLLRDAFNNNRKRMLQAVIEYLQWLTVSDNVREDIPYGKNKRPYYYREYLMHEICERLINADESGVKTYDLLVDAGWYDPKKTGIAKPIAAEMEQQANIAFGHWFRSQGDCDPKYVKLVRGLTRGTKREKETAFYLIRHTISMKGPQNVEVAYALRTLLRKIHKDPKMKRLVQAYRAFFELNIKPVKRAAAS